MQAQVLPRYGGAEEFEVRDIPEPMTAAGQVRVRVRAIGINPMEVKIRNGWLKDEIPIKFPAVIGTEFAGEVDEVGEDVALDGVVPGTPVAGFTSRGSYAELVIADANQIAVVPEGLSLEKAAAIPTAAETAQRVITMLRAKPGETFVVNGAAGAVGSAAVQLLTQTGVHVIGTASAANHPYLARLGALGTTYGDGVVDRIRRLAPDGVDAVFDVVGKDFSDAAITLRGGTDRIVTIADFGAEKMGITVSKGNIADISSGSFKAVIAQAAAGTFVVEIAEVFGFDDIAGAQRLSESGHFRGKIILRGP